MRWNSIHGMRKQVNKIQRRNFLLEVHFEGVGTKQNPSKAIELLKKSAENDAQKQAIIWEGYMGFGEWKW